MYVVFACSVVIIIRLVDEMKRRLGFGDESFDPERLTLILSYKRGMNLIIVQGSWTSLCRQLSFIYLLSKGA